jgi:hypothetical protein
MFISLRFDAPTAARFEQAALARPSRVLWVLALFPLDRRGTNQTVRIWPLRRILDCDRQRASSALIDRSSRQRRLEALRGQGRAAQAHA